MDFSSDPSMDGGTEHSDPLSQHPLQATRLKRRRQSPNPTEALSNRDSLRRQSEAKSEDPLVTRPPEELLNPGLTLTPAQERKLAASLCRLLQHKDKNEKAFKYNHLLEQVRCKAPRVWYMTVKRYMKYQKPVTIAISFKDEVDPDGTIREGRPF